MKFSNFVFAALMAAVGATPTTATHKNHRRGLRGAHNSPEREQQGVVQQVHTRRGLDDTTDIRKVLVVLVQAQNTQLPTSLSEEKASDYVFGTFGDQINLRSQMAACSYGKMQFEPFDEVFVTDYEKGEGFRINNGVITITIDQNFIGKGTDVAEGWVKDKLSSMGILGSDGAPTNNVKHIMVAFPYGLKVENDKDWSAYADLPGSLSYYNQECSNCQEHHIRKSYIQMHEIGHNLGLQHSREVDRSGNRQTWEYADHSGIMGESPTLDGKSCFNGAKTWELGFFQDRVVTIDPIYEGEMQKTFDLVGVSQYDLASGLDVVIVHIDGAQDNYFVAFNLATGINADTGEGQNQVLITKSMGSGEKSNLEAKLDAGGTFLIPSTQFDGKMQVIVSIGGLSIAPIGGVSIAAFPKITASITVDVQILCDNGNDCEYSPPTHHCKDQCDNDSLRVAVDDFFRNKVDAEKKYGPIGDWDVSQVTDFEELFYEHSEFNEDISNWDTSSATSMKKMFAHAYAFNQPIGGWDTSQVTDMRSMFSYATKFNQNIGGWDTSKVSDMRWMFNNADSFNQSIGTWDTSSVTTTHGMFAYAASFNEDIGGWDTSKVNNMISMFSGATEFNQDITNWDTSNVEKLFYTFNGATSFNQHIGSWDTSSVVNMFAMFKNAVDFNQDLGNWDTSRVTDMSSAFNGASSFNQGYLCWDVGSLQSDTDMFHNTSGFNSVGCPPTTSPTASPTASPTVSPTTSPTASRGFGRGATDPMTP